MSTDTAALPRAVPTAQAGAAESMEQYLTFELAGELFAIPILAVQEIRGWESATRVPQAPAHVLGVINLRGAVVPVMDLRLRLAIERADMTAKTVVIVVRIDGGEGRLVTVGCVVDAVSDVANIAEGDVRLVLSLCESVNGSFLRGVAAVDSRLTMLLDLPKLLHDSVLEVPAAAN